MCFFLSFFQDDDMYSDRHALILPPSTGYGNRVHPAPFTDSSYAPCMFLPIFIVLYMNYYSPSNGLVCCLQHKQDQWFLRKILRNMDMEVLLGRIEWKSGRSDKPKSFMSLNMMAQVSMMATSWMILTCLCKFKPTDYLNEQCFCDILNDVL